MTTRTIPNQKKEVEQASLMSTSIRFLKGGLSGVTSGTLLQPLQVIKTSMQIAPVDKVQNVQKTKHLSFM